MTNALFYPSQSAFLDDLFGVISDDIVAHGEGLSRQHRKRVVRGLQKHIAPQVRKLWPDVKDDPNGQADLYQWLLTECRRMMLACHDDPKHPLRLRDPAALEVDESA